MMKRSFMTVLTHISPFSDKRRPLEISVNAPARWLELALAVDHTVIRFHGRERVQQYILALMNIVSTTLLHTPIQPDDTCLSSQES
jgi:hypothetical protein